FCVLRRELSSTLFPYTTLFRSDVAADAERLVAPRAVKAAEDCQRLVQVLVAEADEGHQLETLPRGRKLGIEDEVGLAAPKIGRQDRKSTRLNSSHVKISYAVFC